MLQQVYKDETISRSRVFEWYKKFQEGLEGVGRRPQERKDFNEED